MNDLFAERVFGIPWLTLAAVAAATAVIYAFVSATGDATGATWFVLRWFHTAAWVFIAAAALARARVTGLPIEFSAPLAGTGGLIYVVLMIVTLSGGGSG